MKKHALVLICTILLLTPLLTTTVSADVDEFGRRCDYTCYYYGWNEATQNYDISLYSQTITNGPYPITVGFYQYRIYFADWTYDDSISRYVDMFKASEGWGMNRSMSCYYYYKPAPHSVNYKITGSYLTNDSYQTQSYTSNTTVSVLSNPVVAGYDFNGWTSGSVTIQNGTFTMPSGDVTINGSFTPRTDTPYFVQFYQQDAEGNSYTQIAADTISGKGTTDTPIKNTLDMSALASKYPGFHLSDTSQNNSTVIGGNGTSVLKLYYDRNTPNVNYSFAGKIPLANPAAPATVSHRFGSTVSIAEIPTLAGYDFSGWSSTDLDISSGFFLMPDSNVGITGTWIPHTDTPFAVEVYQQNIEDDGYSKLDADTFGGQGTTDTLTRDSLDMPALESKYPGFHLSEGSKGDASTIDGSGTSVLKLYYDRDTPNVTYNFAGKIPLANPAAPATASHRYGSTVSIAEIPTLAGYDFSGWSSADLDISSGSFTMPDDDVTIAGTWTPHTDTPFAVEVYQQNIEDDGYTKADVFSGQGTTDTQIVRDALGPSVLDAKYPGFHLTDDSLADAMTIDGDGSTVLRLYYDRNTADVAYAYNYTPKNAPELPTKVSTRFGAAVNVAAAPALIGYDFSGWSSDQADLSGGTFSMPDNVVVITGEWTPLLEPYQIEYYLQELDGSYTLTDTEDCAGLTNTQALAPAKGYTGFTETPASKEAEANTTVSGDGSTVLKLYFSRNIYTVCYTYQGDTDTTPPALPAAATYRYGETVPVSSVTPSLQGYDFGGWKTQDAEIADSTFTTPAKDVTITGAWYPKDGIPFQVMYYQQNLDDDDFTLVDTVDGKGVTGTVIPNIHREYEGFIETPESLLAEKTKIASDGSTVVKLYFDRGRYTVSYEYSGGDAIPSDAPALPASKTCKFGETVALPDEPTTSIPGKCFSGWFVNGQAVSGNTFLMPGEDAVVSGVWFAPSGDGAQKAVSVSFVVDGAMIESKEVKSGGPVEKPAAPSKTGYTFAGWYADSDYTEPWDFETGTVTASMVLYAKWVPGQYTVRFNCNGGSDVPAQTVAYGGVAARPAAPTRTGYDFTGWYADSALRIVWSFTEDTIQADTTLYAAWTARQYTVAFESNGGSSVSSQQVAYGKTATQPAAPTKAGYTFAGWYADSTLNDVWSFSGDTIQSDITLYAKWMAAVLPPVSSERGVGCSEASHDVPSDNLMVTFDSTGGSTISAQLVRYGQLLEKPSVNPEKAGYTFAGWFTDPDYTHAWSFPATVSQNTMLYAKWIEVEKPVSAAFPVEEQATDVAEAPLQDSFRINNRMILAAVAALCLLAFFTLLVIWSKRVKFYCMDGDGAYRTLCHGVIRHGSIDITSAYQAANEGTVMVRISRFYALVHLKGQISIRLKEHTLLTDQLSLNNKYVIAET